MNLPGPGALPLASLQGGAAAGSLADLLVTSAAEVVVYGGAHVEPIVPVLLATLANVVPHTKGLSPGASALLLRIVSTLASPAFIGGRSSRAEMLICAVEVVASALLFQHASNGPLLEAILLNAPFVAALAAPSPGAAASAAALAAIAAVRTAATPTADAAATAAAPLAPATVPSVAARGEAGAAAAVTNGGEAAPIGVDDQWRPRLSEALRPLCLVIAELLPRLRSSDDLSSPEGRQAVRTLLLRELAADALTSPPPSPTHPCRCAHCCS